MKLNNRNNKDYEKHNNENKKCYYS
jgi:hypothetical protein